jgi:hypothetical protein
MRRLLPWRIFEIETRLSPEEIEATLSPYVDPTEPGLFYGRASAAPWIGRINRERLVMRRHITYRNSFLPCVVATIERRLEGALVRVRMRMHLLTELFMVLWMGGAGAGCAWLAIRELAIERNPAGLLALAFPLVGLLMIGVGFAPEARRAEAFLREHLPPPVKLPGTPFR